MEKRTVKKRARVGAANAIVLPASYLVLLGEFPLFPIRTSAQYTRAAAVIHRLALREGTLDPAEEAYLEVLEGLTEQYDRTHSAFAPDGTSPTRLLNMLVGQAGMSVTELGKLIGSKGAASELLSGKRREPSKTQIAKLCRRFKVDASAFLLKGRQRGKAA